jgi:Ca-activated chloride channel homolog
MQRILWLIFLTLASTLSTFAQERPRPVLTNKSEVDKPAEAKAQTNENDDVIRIDTALIYVPVRVMDRDGKYIPDLQAKNFKIYEDGVEQEIEHFSAVDDPFNVVVLLDTSGSTRFKIEDIQDAAVTFIEQLRPQDRVMVVSFNQRVWVDAEFTNDRTTLMKAILRTRTGSSTSIYDAVDLVLTERLSRVQGRKAIVLFSDGVDTSSHLATLESTIERVEESNSILYSVHYDTQDAVIATRPLPVSMVMPGTTKEDYQRAEKYLLELANRSGGRFYEAATLGDAKQAFASIAEELRRQYGLGYYSKNDSRDGAFRKIRVQGDNPNWAIRSRLGYRAPKK